MSNPIRLILGACLSISAMPLQARNLEANSPTPLSEQETFELMNRPLYHENHEQELLSSMMDLPPETMRASSDSRLYDQSYARSYARFIHKHVHDSLPKDFRRQARQIATVIIQSANQHKMDPVLLMAVIKHESRFDPSAKGLHGEIGLMQIKPSTARWLFTRIIRKDRSDINEIGLQKVLVDPVANIRIGTAYLAFLRQRFKGKPHSYLSAYNMGASRVRSHLANGVEPRIYSNKVMSQYLTLNTELGIAHGIAVNASARRSIAQHSAPQHAFGL
jgi:soluble lytic murein transglycosylase-like protein